MANIKSAKKRALIARANNIRNRAMRSRVKTASKKVLGAVQAGDKALALDRLSVAIKTLLKAAQKGVYHKNAVSRKMSSLEKTVRKMA